MRNPHILEIPVHRNDKEENMLQQNEGDYKNHFYSDLKCCLKIFGHKNQGEAILLTLQDEDFPMYSCVIDSFSRKGSIPIDIALAEMKIGKIDDFIWTHPHRDHSGGIIKIIKKYKPERIYIPLNLGRVERDCNTTAQNIINFFLNNISQGNKSECCINSLCNNMYIQKASLKDLKTNRDIDFCIYAVAPDNSYITQKGLNNMPSFPNDFSIAIYITFNDFIIFLTSDLENGMINKIRKNSCFDFPFPNLLKIPHHGSSGSLDILNVFSRTQSDPGKINYSISTSFQKKLPEDISLQAYKTLSENVFYIDKNSDKIACWILNIDLNNSVFYKYENFKPY